MTEVKLNLRQKLASIYDAVSHIDKYGENTGQHYHYVRAADVLHAIRKSLASVGVYAQTNYTLLGTYEIKTNKGGIMHTATVRADVTFMDTDTGETISVSGLGDGADSGDKGIYKAQTGATKNALRNAFLVPDEADPEADASVDAATSGQYEEPAAPVRKPYSATSRTPPPDVFQQVGQGRIAQVPQAAIPTSFDEIPESGNLEPAAEVAESQIDVAMPAGTGALPTEKELDAYRARFVQFADTLKDSGFKPSKNLPIVRKAIPYLLQVTGQPDVPSITTTQWDTFFEFVAKLLSLDDGAKQLVKLVNDAAKAQEAKA